MTFHLDVLDAGGQPARVTFSTLYPVPPTTPTNRGTARRLARADDATCRGPSLDGGQLVNAASATAATTVVAWKNGSGGRGSEEGTGASALARRGGAMRCPVSFDTSRSRGWTVVAVDMVNLMREGRGAGGKGYGLLRGVRLGSNMVVRGVYASDCVYSPQTLPKEMSFRVPGGGDWESAYGWLWLPEVRDENFDKPSSRENRHKGAGERGGGVE